jgi:hypothetical protein
MSDGPRVRVRGIYATALTALFLERGATIVEPSQPIQERLGVSYVEGPEEASVFDRRDRQGVIVEGVEASVSWAINNLAEALPDCLFRPRHRYAATSPEAAGQGMESLRSALAGYVAEFPATVKGQLDQIRSVKAPTLPGHHYLKVVDPDAVDEAERELMSHPDQGEHLAHCLRQNLIYKHFRRGLTVVVRHIKADRPFLGPGIELTGRVNRSKPGHLLLTRRFRPGGTYDGLGEPKEEGDWGTIFLKEGSWVTRRRYFRKNGDPIGDLYNINTPVEFFPDHLRYVDLELDVARLPDGTFRLEDQEVLEDRIARGLMPESLARAARAVAARLIGRLEASGTLVKG